VPVLPLRGKLPRIPAAHRPGDPLYQQCRGGCGRQGHGVHDASTDLEQVGDWWDRWPHANVGLRTGVIFDVIDVDGPQGRQSLERFLAEHSGGPIGGPRVRTGSGGWHLYVRPSGLPDRIGVLDSVDYRAADRYVVAPPSHHPTTGRRYQWVPGRDLHTTLLGQLPPALRERLTPRPVELRRTPAPMRPTEPGHPYGRAVLEAETARIASARAPNSGRGGERNQVLWEAARNLYNLVAGGVLDQAQVEQELERAAAACGLLSDEPRQTQRTLASARQVGLAHPRGIPERSAGRARGRGQPAKDASHHPPFRPHGRAPSPER
jgi:Bifunctional DNA primase/polymerase, N-terminal